MTIDVILLISIILISDEMNIQMTEENSMEVTIISSNVTNTLQPFKKLETLKKQTQSRQENCAQTGRTLN